MESNSRTNIALPSWETQSRSAKVFQEPKTRLHKVLEDTLNQQPGRFVRVLNFSASAYSVKQMAASLEYRMVDIQPDLVVLAMIPENLNVLRTPGIDAGLSGR